MHTRERSRLGAGGALLAGLALVAGACEQRFVVSARLAVVPGAQPAVGLLASSVVATHAGCADGAFSRAVRSPSGWAGESLPALGPAQCRSQTQWVLAPGGTEYVVFERDGTEIWASTGARGWTRVTASPSLPEGAVRALDAIWSTGTTWVASDGTVRALVGQWLLTIEGTTVTAALRTGRTCSVDRTCYFAPTGDASGRAAMYDTPGTVVLRSLTCDEARCTWTDEGPLGLDQGGNEHRAFFLTTRGVPVFVHVVYTGGDGTSPLGVDTNTSHQVLQTDAFMYDGAPLADGGAAVASVDYEGTLRVYTSDASLSFASSVLGTVSGGTVSVLATPRPEGGEDLYVAAFDGIRAHVYRIDPRDRSVLATEHFGLPSR